MDAHTHLAETHARLTTSPVVLRYDVVEERLGPDFGYLRVRVDLGDDGFLEMAEYFVIEASSVTVKRYRHHWMDSSQTVLKKRWDNARHHPELPTFPHHIHDGSESNVVSGTAMAIVDVIVFLEEQG